MFTSTFRKTAILFLILFFLPTFAIHSSAGTIRFVPIGDSYTIGQGVAEDSTWPALLTRNLIKSGIDIKLTANPARTGWRVEEAIEKELPVFEKTLPHFATLLIGVNDWVQGSGRKKFTSLLGVLMDRMLAILPAKERLLVITIPDFSCAPNGQKYGFGRNITKGISTYNSIIKDQAQKRELRVVDIFPLSRKFCGRPEMFVEDGIHPSARQYKLWEELIFPGAFDILNQ